MIADELRRRIRTGELRPGDRLPGHRELAAAFSVSVGSVREAISMLVSAGLIETRAARGTYVAGGSLPDAGRPLEREHLEELVKARELVESQIAWLAAERADARQLRRLRACQRALRAAADEPAAFLAAERAFHSALAEAAGNRFLLRWLQDVRELLRFETELSVEAAVRRFGTLGPTVDLHAALVDAVEARDPAAARRIALEIIRRSHEFVLGLYALVSPGEASAATG